MTVREKNKKLLKEIGINDREKSMEYMKLVVL